MFGLRLVSAPVYFIIKATPIRGKPSCAATWPQSFASAEIADSRQILDFQISDFRGPTGGICTAVPRLTSSPPCGWRITLPGDMSAAGLKCDDGGWERSCQ